jgi:hypothetical protein
MAGAYKIMLKKQIAMAARNRMCRETHQSDVHFKKGEQVLYWQPAAGRLKDAPPTANDDALPAHDAPADDGAPMDRTVKKLMQPWTGPHLITRQVDDNYFEFVHSSSGQTLTSHVNRLVRFFPWSDDLPSTSPEYDTARAWKTSGDIMPGATVLITAPTTDLSNRHQNPVPFRIGRISTLPDREATTTRITVHWYGNKGSNARGSYRPAWRTPSGSIYFSTKMHNKVDVAHESALPRKSVIIHSFPLLPALRLPNPVLRAAQASGRTAFDLFD